MRKDTDGQPQNESPINLVSQSAIKSLNRYLTDPKESVLREYQMSVVQSLKDLLEGGCTSGYISLPSGSGKTVIAAELAGMLGLKTVILSPTLLILGQTHDTVTRFSPATAASQYHAGEKDLTGQVINTTYQSFMSLLKKGEINPNEIELLICDEVHTALGELRHKIFRQVPNALKIGLTATPYFNPLEGFQRRGVVKKDEPWLRLFNNCIHDMPLEEVMERGILAPLDVHLITTDTSVKDIKVNVSGEYETGKLDRQLNTLSRNYLAVGLVAGVESIPDYIRIPAQRLNELRYIHELIKGKRTVIFGMSVKHIEHLQQLLTDAGVTAAVIHGGIQQKQRDDILDKYTRGEINVILGVDLLRLGWDSPATEVGLYLAPTQSGIVAVQELGRILRPSPETGKKRAMAIQMVDMFNRFLQRPVLIPNVFDPTFVLRGTQTGELPVIYASKDQKAAPAITFSGLNINTIIEEATSNALLQHRFRRATIKELGPLIDDTVEAIRNQNPDADLLDFYRIVADTMPQRIAEEKQQQALQAIAGTEPAHGIHSRVLSLQIPGQE